MIYNDKLLSEALRPNKLNDIVTLSEKTINSFQRMIDNNSPMNMIFYGKPGTGKTSTARIFLKELDCDFIELNGSNHGGIARIFEDFTSSYSLFNKPKLVFVDEADYLHKDVQGALRFPIERSSSLVRFIFTGNEHSRFMDAITSRCMPVCFDIPIVEIKTVIKKMIDRYTIRLDELGYDADQDIIKRIVTEHYPDFRAIANQFQFELAPKLAA